MQGYAGDTLTQISGRLRWLKASRQEACMSSFVPILTRHPIGANGVEVRLGHELLDEYLRFVAARCRPNSVLAAGYDLKVFFSLVQEDPVRVSISDVLEFIAAQRLPAHGSNVVRLDDGEQGLSARTIRRRLATLSGFYGYLQALGLVTSSPVPTGLSVRQSGRSSRSRRSTPLIRTPRTLPRFQSRVFRRIHGIIWPAGPGCCITVQLHPPLQRRDGDAHFRGTRTWASGQKKSQDPQHRP
jgi:hypothetical protein